MTDKKKRNTSRPFVYGQANNQCVWSRAGVVKPMLCINTFDCLGCSFDSKVQSDFEACAKDAPETDNDPRTVRLRMLINQRKCRHMLSGRIDYKLCGHSYDCVRCPYDQMVEDTGLQQNLNAPACENASGFNIARDYYYHHGHTWARVEYGGRIRIGIDDFALRLLGPQDKIRLPKLGTTIEQGSPQATLMRSDNTAETLSPVDGKVIATNPAILAKADTANNSPYSDGWLMVLQPLNLRKNLKNLLFGEESLGWLDDEAGRLTTHIGDTTDHRLAATGGEVISDIYGSLPGLDWDHLVSEFLR